MATMRFSFSYGPNPHLIRYPRRISSPIFSKNKEENQNWDGLKFIRGNKLLKDFTTWGIGGPCSYFLQVFHPSHLLSAIRFCDLYAIPYVVIGKGSNCLFDDLGFAGCVILNRMEFLERMEPGVYRAGSGFRFNQLGMLTCNEGFTGLEFAAGVPGTVGGATYMNAGANGQETANSIESVDIVTTEGNFQTLSRDDLSFGYRYSPFQDMENLAAILAVKFRLQGSGSARKRQQELLKRRLITQPIGERSAGSVFRNPTNLGVSAAGLIDKSGLKGSSIGGAMVSHIHANFFVNNGGATSQDMLNLIALVKDKVDKKFGVRLEEEVLYFPHCNYINRERLPSMNCFLKKMGMQNVH